MTTIENSSGVEDIKAVDLRNVAEQAYADGQTVRYEWRKNGDALSVETLIVDGPAGLRAGQATNSSAVWGDWSEARQTLTTDDGLVLDLDGNEVETLDARLTKYAQETAADMDAPLRDGVASMDNDPQIVAADIGCDEAAVRTWARAQLAAAQE